MTVPRNYKSRSRQGDPLARDRSPRGPGTPEKHVFEVISEEQAARDKVAKRARQARYEGRSGAVTLPTLSIPGVRSEFTPKPAMTPDRPVPFKRRKPGDNV